MASQADLQLIESTIESFKKDQTIKSVKLTWQTYKAGMESQVVKPILEIERFEPKESFEYDGLSD